MAKLYRSDTAQDTALKRAATIRSLIDGFERTIRILDIDITTEEERVRIFDRSDAAYPVLARTLIIRRDNQITTVADLKKRLSTITATMSAAVSQAA
jgi:hypothetical protein